MTFFKASSENVTYLKKDCHVQQNVTYFKIDFHVKRNKIFNFYEVQISTIQYYIM